MKFFADLGSCYRPSAQEEPDNCVQVVVVRECNETWSKPRQKKMNESKYWRPELSVIWEDRVVSFLEIDQLKAHHHHHQYEKKVSSKSKTRSTAKPAPSSCYYNDDHYHPRKNSMPMMIPAFMPTPFMF